MKYHQGVGGGRRKKGGRSTHEIRRKSVYKAREGEPVGSNRGGRRREEYARAENLRALL